MTPETPAEYKQAILNMRMTNPFVHRAVTAQEMQRLTNEEMLAVLAYHVIKSHDDISAAYMKLLERLPPQAMIAPNE